ncbi:Type 1 glutamine amidotransferase-like domain-containing protein [Salinibacterium soli]|uniref:Type 1 glutamine amidotransferase-like domain-containing protein n=1 Tax=Antiquaquibacter soli TaxID=3064523 RepID=A0ABT9BMK1_9MICO|nr:Type 1 glutamine amidotransferase-like domain-containing protein [Protaetiibacter sp. WY-16]MDO7882259.1 Type 1 glutamine amidotransferase-like domain-containing protein [Protaetiibacter sp. WY-16]
MKLYLSSYGLGNAGHELAALAGSRTRTALVMNALDGYGDRLTRQIAENVEALAAIGLHASEVDLRDYFGRAGDLERDLAEFGVVWAVGGNSFVLRRAMRESGFDGAIAERVRAGDLVYGGFSAGAVVATSTLRGIESVDPPDDVPPGYPREVVWEGLGFVETALAPHYRSPHPESAAVEAMVAEFTSRGVPVLALRDGDALLVDGASSRVVG